MNQLVIGYNYFKQTFNASDTVIRPRGGWAEHGRAGRSRPERAAEHHAQRLSGVGGTQPLGRVDKTLQFTNTLSYATGAHQLKVGADYRPSKLFIFYDSNKRGTLPIDGTVGPWASLPTTQASPSLKALADFMAGMVATGSIVRGNTHHDYYQHTLDLFVQDTWTVSSNITLNLGAPLHLSGRAGASDGPAHNFLPDQGMVSTENSIRTMPITSRRGSGSRTRRATDKMTVIRGSYGIFFDMLAVNFFTANTGFANGGALGVGNNPGGTTPVLLDHAARFTYDCEQSAGLRDDAAAAVRRLCRQPGS